MNAFLLIVSITYFSSIIGVQNLLNIISILLLRFIGGIILWL